MMYSHSMILAALSSLILCACATPTVVQSVKPGDSGLSCAQLQNEYADAERFRAEANAEKSVTGGNVVRALLFWPAILGTASNANEAIAAADSRKVNLANLMNQKNCAIPISPIIVSNPTSNPSATSNQQAGLLAHGAPVHAQATQPQVKLIHMGSATIDDGTRKYEGKPLTGVIFEIDLAAKVEPMSLVVSAQLSDGSTIPAFAFVPKHLDKAISLDPLAPFAIQNLGGGVSVTKAPDVQFWGWDVSVGAEKVKTWGDDSIPAILPGKKGLRIGASGRGKATLAVLFETTPEAVRSFTILDATLVVVAPQPPQTPSTTSGPPERPPMPAVVPQAAMEQSRCSASYTINVTVVLSSTLTRGENRVMVELRQGTPGASKAFDTKYFEGQTGTVSFSKMCAGPYFIAIGNGDSVAVGPVRQFSESQSVRTSVRVTPSSGNVGTRSRSNL